MEKRMRVPAIVDIPTAVRIYYTKNELRRMDICELFGCTTSKATRLKQLAEEQMKADGIMMRSQLHVSTDAAYKAWGLDIGSLEARMRKMEKLGFVQESKSSRGV